MMANFINGLAVVAGALLFGAGLVLLLGWPVLLLLAGAVLMIWGVVTQ